MISKDALQHILAETESYRIERTVSTDNADKFCQAICAFSNDISGKRKNGYLIIGVHDNGKLSGLKVDDKLLLKISNIRTDGNILPQPVMTVEKFSFDAGDVLVAEVQPSDFPPVRYCGRVWVRVGPRKSMASEAEEKILTERRLSNVRTFDARPCLGTTIADLDVAIFKKEFLPQAIAADVLAEDKRPIEEQLASLGFFDFRYNCPTMCAIILFGKTPERYLPGSYVQYVRFKGKDRAGDIINEHKFSGNLCKELIKIDAFIETSIAQKRPIPVSVLREETVSKYPYWATRELLMNAIMHRDYETNTPVQFYEYDDRIEVQNPGGLYGKVNLENFPDVNDYRNPFIAEAMKVLGYVNRFSRGVFRVQKELIENGNGEASFDFSLFTAFRVIEKVSVRYFEAGFGLENNQDYPENTTPISENTTPKTKSTTPKSENTSSKMKNTTLKSENTTSKMKNTTPKTEVSTTLKTKNTTPITEKTTPITEVTTQKILPRKYYPENTTQNIENILSEPSAIYQRTTHNLENTTSKHEVTTLKSEENTTKKKLPRKHYPEKILQIISENPGITRKELSNILDITLDGVKYHLKNMIRKGFIKREGSNRAGKWLIAKNLTKIETNN